jgi:amino acid transporter
MIVLFTFLTFYSAYFDVVKDCGCFGDALKLKPWESFMKDVVLLFFILFYSLIKISKTCFANSVQNIITYASIILCMFLGVWVLNHLPLMTFVPLK